MSKPLIPAQRRERILDYLAIHRIARNSDLSQLLDASEATIRRDLEWLETEGLIKRTHGGAVQSQHLDAEAEYRHRAQLFAEEKRYIGQAAASLIEDGDTIFINSGTTSTQIIHYLRDNANITVITNNLIAVLEVGEVDYELILLGGAFQPRSNSVAGRFAIANISQVYANKAFIGVDGLNLRYGCTVPSMAEAELVRLMIERTHGKIMIAADHSKWGVVSNYEVAQIDQINKLITDSNLDAAAQVSLRSRNIDILMADKIINKRKG
ncbi:MAG: DeoR/GlpR transcriptional regulator [Anaerolineales bacterium]|nr:DeoR/GlpR transcriptional regulator [Anaerolineales bacterium]